LEKTEDKQEAGACVLDIFHRPHALLHPASDAPASRRAIAEGMRRLQKKLGGGGRRSIMILLEGLRQLPGNAGKVKSNLWEVRFL
jgi:hypothetical protein